MMKLAFVALMILLVSGATEPPAAEEEHAATPSGAGDDTVGVPAEFQRRPDSLTLTKEEPTGGE